MKASLLALVILSSQNSRASEAQWCDDFEQVCGAAKLVMDSVIAYSNLNPAESYACGISRQEEVVEVNYRPRWGDKIDWYKLTYRKSDCRV